MCCTAEIFTIGGVYGKSYLTPGIGSGGAMRVSWEGIIVTRFKDQDVF